MNLTDSIFFYIKKEVEFLSKLSPPNKITWLRYEPDAILYLKTNNKEIKKLSRLAKEMGCRLKWDLEKNEVEIVIKNLQLILNKNESTNDIS